ncbi:MAG: hypothetical protein ACAF41_01595 [Leptolyngbya sp. BL-A-14]
MNRRILQQTMGMLFLGLLLAQAQRVAAQAQPTPEVTIDQFLRSNAPLPGADAQAQQQYLSLRSWMGAYQATRQEGNHYLAMFEQGALPVFVELNASGQIKRYGAGCPRSQSLSLSQLPAALRQVWSKCTTLSP